MSKVLMPDFEEFCRRLHGEFGRIYEDEIVDCPRCFGMGEVDEKYHSISDKYVECEDCGGSGEYVKSYPIQPETIRRIYHRAITKMGEPME